jgi:hypothetical protein
MKHEGKLGNYYGVLAEFTNFCAISSLETTMYSL